MAEKSTRGRRPGPSTTHEEILEATRWCLKNIEFEKITLRKIADRAGVSDSLLVHQFGSRDKLIAAALAAPKGLDFAFSLMRKFPRKTWGRVLAEAISRGQIRDEAARETLETLLRASAQSEACAQIVTDWVAGELLDYVRSLGVSFPEVRARAFATVLFGSTFSNQILLLDPHDKKAQRAQTAMTAHVLQAILGEEL